MLLHFIKSDNMATNKNKEIAYETMMAYDAKAFLDLLPDIFDADVAEKLINFNDNALVLLGIKIVDSRLKVISINEITPGFIKKLFKGIK